MDEEAKIRKLVYAFINAGLSAEDVSKILSIVAEHASPIMEKANNKGDCPIEFAESTLAILKSELQTEAFGLINQSIPGGMIGAFYEPGYPLFFYNDAILKFLGYSRADFISAVESFAINLIDFRDRALVEGSIHRAFESDNEFEVRHRIVKNGGDIAWVIQRGRIEVDDDGKKILFGAFSDVTEIVNLQNELESQAQILTSKNVELEALTNNVPGGVATMRMDSDLTLLYANPFFYGLCGYTPEQFLYEKNSKWIKCIYHDDLKIVEQAISMACKNNSAHFEFETRLVKRNLDIIWVLVCGSLIKTVDGFHVHSVTLDITARKQMEQELRLSEERFRIALEKSSNVIFDYDMASGKIMHSSLSNRNLDHAGGFCEEADSLIPNGNILPEFITVLKEALKKIQDGEEQSECVVKVLLSSGVEIWNRISMTAVTDSFGYPARAIGMIEDITQQKEAELAYAREEQYRRAILSDAMASYIVNFSKDVIESSKVESPLCVQAEAGSEYDRYIRESALSRLFEEDKNTFINNFSRKNILDAFKKGESEIKLEYRYITPNGNIAWMLTRMRLLLDAATNDKKGFMYVMDIDKQKREELDLTKKSECDPLTGLYNKGVAREHIQARLRTADAVQTGVFMMIDLDHFKDINDTYGHPFGDKVLISAAKIIRESFRETDIVGRLGGDEFCVFFCGIRSKMRIINAANSICKNFRKIFDPTSGNPGSSCSIGISMCNGTSKSFDRIYSEADDALYRVKNTGRDGCAFYDDVIFEETPDETDGRRNLDIE